MYRTEFAVRGKGTFPLDMLRYDACFPSTSNDVFAMEDDTETRTVVLVRYHPRKDHNIAVGRWNSFGWSCEIRYTSKSG